MNWRQTVSGIVIGVIDDHNDRGQIGAASCNQTHRGMDLASGFDPVVDQHDARTWGDQIAAYRESWRLPR